MAAGCDAGPNRDQPPGVSGIPLADVHLVGANVGMDAPLPANGSIELQFDRVLLPAAITRQTFSLQGAGGSSVLTPSVTYDPVSRVVTITPMPNTTPMVEAGQSYQLVINPPANGGDVNGVRAFDGATLAGGKPIVIAFNAVGPVALPPPVQIDYCRDIEPIFQQKCGYIGSCHLAAGTPIMPAAGLVLEPAGFVAQTAIGRVAHGANTGPRSVAAPPSLLFGEDMPIVDGAGNASNSWLLYKVLIAVPTPEPDAGALPDAGASPDAGPPVDVATVHAPFQLTDMPAAERAELANYILGQPMPIVPFGSTSAVSGPLTLDQMERVSLWISQGAQTPAFCPSP